MARPATSVLTVTSGQLARLREVTMRTMWLAFTRFAVAAAVAEAPGESESVLGTRRTPTEAAGSSAGNKQEFLFVRGTEPGAYIDHWLPADRA